MRRWLLLLASPTLALPLACHSEALNVGGASGSTGDAYSNAVLGDAPLAYVRFIGGDAIDVTGKARLERRGIAIVDDAPSGLTSRSGRFAGSDWLSIEENWFSLLGSNGAQGTFEAWVKLGTTSAQRRAVISSDMTEDKSWIAVWASAEGIGFTRYDALPPSPFIDAGAEIDGGTYTATNPGDVPILHVGTNGAFHHVVATFGSSGCRMSLYVDASLVGKNDDCVNMSRWSRILVGAGSSEGLAGVEATIADIAIYGDGISAARVLAHYAAAGH